MVGKSQESSLGVEELLAGGTGATRGVPGSSRQQASSGVAVLSRAVIVAPEDVEIVFPSSLVADLHDPSLVISHGYVGPDRRRFDRASPPVPSGPPAWLRRIRSVALLTAMVVLPLTAISARSVPPASVGAAPSQSAQAAPTAKAQARADRQAQRAITANAAQMARAEALGEEIPARDQAIFAAVKRHHESNPMLGLRGVRLGILIPDLYKMQVRALVHAYLEVRKLGHNPMPEVMIPLVATQRELLYLRETLEEEIKKTFIGTGQSLEIPIGTMIETPRAAITADRLGHYADFFSFGTNDLTQLTWAFSRDDVESSFLPRYLDLELLPFSPFESLDQAGVGILVRTATQLARSLRPDFKLGICGEHGGDPRSIHFFHDLGLDYVSCSPFRVPVARLESGRAKILKSATGSSTS